MNKEPKLFNILKNGDDFEVSLDVESQIKHFESPNYNYLFNLINGNFARWGKTKKEDPIYSIYGPEIADVEISTCCNGINGKLCCYCYKSNSPNGYNMPFEVFKHIIEQINYNNQLTQVAFGLDSTATANPDLWKMCNYLRDNHIIPNGTVAQLDDETAIKIGMNFGGCAVSYHSDFEVLANTIEKLGRARVIPGATLSQINVHFILSEETYEDCLQLIKNIKSDIRYKENLNAVVLLGLKKCGRATSGFNTLSDEKFLNLVKLFFEENIGFGFDSCSCIKAEKAIKKIFEDKNKQLVLDNFEVRTQVPVQITKQILLNEKKLEMILQMCEPCESGIFSAYSDVNGNFHYCSFCEHLEGFNLLGHEKFKNYWESGEKMLAWREKLLNNKRSCPEYIV